MDYSKVKFVTPSVDGKDFTKGKVYAFEFSFDKGGYVTGNDEEKKFIFIPRSAHLEYNPFIPCHEDGTPLTKEMTALEAEMLAMLEDIHSELINGETPRAYKIEELIKKIKK